MCRRGNENDRKQLREHKWGINSYQLSAISYQQNKTLGTFSSREEHPEGSKLIADS